MALFIGYKDIRTKIFSRLRHGGSAAVISGRKCGATSFLQSLATEFAVSDTQGGFLAIPVYLSMREIVPRVPGDLFQAMLARAAQVLHVPAPTGPPANYTEVQQQLRTFLPTVSKRFGNKWRLLFLIDSLDLAAATLPDQQGLEDLQRLLLNPEFAPYLRVVGSGGVELDTLVNPGGALDSMGALYFRPYTRAESHELIEQQFGSVLVEQLIEPVLATTGRHPYLLFSLLRQWAESTFEPTISNVRLLAQSVLRDRRGTFEQWFEDFGEDGREVFHALAVAPGQKLSFNELRMRVKRPNAVDRAIVTLNYHCLVDDTNPDEPALAGSMFRDWFLRNYTAPIPKPESAPQSAPAPAATPNRRVFVVHGRNTRIKVAMFTFLRALGLQPIEWHEAVDACDSPAPHVSDILTAGFNMAVCAVVLFTGDDEARLHPEFQTPDDAPFEKNYTGQARPNVLFEAGMSWALFPKRTVFVKVGEVRPFSDLSGVHLQELDGSLDRRRQTAMRLKKAGCEILNLDTTTAWQYEGDFSYTPARSASA